MPAAINGYAGARSSTGLLITVAIHAGLGAALLSLGVVKLPGVTVTPPIEARNIPVAQPEMPPPPIPNSEVDVPLVAPKLTIAPDLPPAPPAGLTTAIEPALPGPVEIGDPIDAPDRLLPAPVMVMARLDARYASRFQPPYPPASERLEEEGVVTVRVRIGTDGRVLAAEVKASSGHRRLDAAAVSHARRAWRFTPATSDGVAVESWREIPVRFALVNG